LVWAGGGGAAPPHGRGDRLGVFEVGRQRLDAIAEIARVAAEPRDVPAVVEEAPGEVASADPGDADDERAIAHWPTFGR
jgi:hypothetical protein